MATLNSLKGDMLFMRDMGNIIDVFKSAALLQFRVVQSRACVDDKSLARLDGVMRILSQACASSPFFTRKGSLPALIVVFSSDEGFMGEIGTQVVNAALDLRRSLGSADFVVVGERGLRYIQDVVPGDHTLLRGISDEISFREAAAIGELALARFGKSYDAVYAVYADFISLTQQRVLRRQLFPYEPPKDLQAPRAPLGDLMFEPDPESAVRGAAEQWLKMRLWEIAYSAKQSEFAARIMHLEGSTQELATMNKKLKLAYFKHVHSANDKSIREISASKSITKKK
jgi:F-type H+-transporting ATPase subunit gamma